MNYEFDPLSIITANECQQQLKELYIVEQQASEIIIKRIDAAIRIALTNGRRSVSVTVPQYIYGLPNFDVNDTKNRVKQFFVNAGFVVIEISTYDLSIEWPVLPPFETTRTNAINVQL